MIRPLRIAVPWDSQPMSGSPVSSTAIVRNTATGLAIPINTYIGSHAGDYYQTSDWVLCAGYDYFSLIFNLTSSDDVELPAIPVAASNPSQQLDAISWGSMTPGNNKRINIAMSNVFGFYLRFTAIGEPLTLASIGDVIELQLTKP